MKKAFFGVLAAALVALFASTQAAYADLTDIPAGHWAEDAVKKLYEMGIIEGYPDRTFKGERPMTRYEYAILVDRLVKWTKKHHDENPSGIGEDQIKEITAIVEKLQAEFRDELAALRLEVEQVKDRVGALEADRMKGLNMRVTGSLRQRVDIPNSDLNGRTLSAALSTVYPELPADDLTTPLVDEGISVLDPGYEANPNINIEAKGGENVTFKTGLSAYIRNRGLIAQEAHHAATPVDALSLQYAYADIDFKPSVSELDTFAMRVGYQAAAYGQYGLVFDNNGLTSSPALRLDLGKDRVSLSAIAGFTSSFTGGVQGMANLEGLGSSGSNDTFTVGRLGVDLDAFDAGITFLGNGITSEKAWGLDLNLPLLNDSDFLKNLNGDFMQVTDSQAGTDPAASEEENSFVMGLDLYQTSETSVNVSYAEISNLITGYTSVDHNPFTEYDMWTNTTGASGGTFASLGSGVLMYPDDFKGYGLKASHRILGDTIVSAKAWKGDRNICAAGTCEYPGVGAVEVLKPINDKTSFRVEYMQQGLDNVLLSRVRGELMLNF